VAVHSGMDVTIGEPDVSPLQLQGPKSGEIMMAMFGESIMDLKYYWLREVELDGIPLIVSRTGWSSELGYELYLQDGSRGDELWEKIMAAGVPFGLKPGHTSSIRRIEGAMLSYHADADINTNPFELGLDRLVNLDIEADFIGKANFFEPTSVTRGDALEITTAELGALTFPPDRAEGENLTLAIRPEKLRLGEDHGDVRLTARLGDVAFQGERSNVELLLPSDRALLASVHGDAVERVGAMEEGDEISVSWRRDDMLVLAK